MNKFSKIAFILLFFAGACSSERNTFTNRTFHNLTARYNAFYLADVKIKEVEADILTNHKEDYTQILPVFIPIDSSVIQSNKEKLQSARELASKAIDWHRISKWVDDSYYLLGKIDYLQAQFEEAQNTFKYVNVEGKDKDLRHKNLVSLLRLYVDLKEYEKANFTIDYLSKEEEINEENRYNLYQTLAYYYESRSDKNGVIGALQKALEFKQNAKETSRINFILAQYYQKEGIDAQAYSLYQKSLEGNPPYERSFFAQLYAQQVAELNASKDLRKVRNYYEELYKNPKNEDLKDVVVYEMALFEEKQGDIDKTIDLLHQAAKEPGSNPRLKGYIYQKLADVSLNTKKDYRATKYYLDSALTFINENDPIALTIKNQKETLDKFVFHVERISKNDSLINLSSLSLEEQTLIAENFLKQEEERLLDEARAEEAEKSKSSSVFENLLSFSSKGSGSSFYFDNLVAMQQGAVDFSRIWGGRTLQDNWRRSLTSFQTTASSIEFDTDLDSTAVESNPVQILPEIQTLLSNIPSTPDAISLLNGELEESLFELGKVLFFDLKEPKQSIENLELLVQKFPESSKKPEAYYLLYLGQKELGGNFQQYISRLNREFPNSQYTYSVNNPNASSGNLAYIESSKKYEQAYNAYYSGNYSDAKNIIKSTLSQFPITRNTERLILLDIMVTGKTESKELFRERLEFYIEDTKEEQLVELARNMLNPLLASTSELEKTESKDSISDSTQVKEIEVVKVEETKQDSTSRYKVNESQTHIFIIALEPREAESLKSILSDLENFHSNNFANARLRTGNMNMNRENSIFIISPFGGGEKALEYYKKFKEEFESEGFSEVMKEKSFFISIENFQELNKTKNIEEYLTFFESVYK
jgi:tetratricopeptide (TPR) repeat protein